MATLNENIDRIENAKTAIKNAIVAKGVAVEDTALIDTYADKIGEIPTGGGGLDLTGMGYSEEQKTILENNIVSDFNYTRQKFSEWDTGRTDAFNLYAYDTKLKYVPMIDTHNVTNFAQTFWETGSIQYIPLWDTSNAVDMSGMFGNSTASNIPLFNTQNVTNMHQMFQNFKGTTIPAFNTQNVVNMESFARGSKIFEFPAFNMSKVENIISLVYNNINLTTIPELDFSSVRQTREAFDYCYELANLGGFKGLKVSLNLNNDKLTKESLMNVINDLAQADPAIEAEPTLTICSIPFALLTAEDIKIATDKGWKVVSV